MEGTVMGIPKLSLRYADPMCECFEVGRRSWEVSAVI